tara:strand:+ start:864 stop:1655 length:792 start_codon:yes stop_codon:yes gene_type:complete
MPQRNSTKKQKNRSSFRKQQNEKRSSDDGKIRLNKFIANAGVCSRREADKFIEAGVVSVNGLGITEMGFRVSLTDEVKFNGQRLKSEKLRYILLNKPKNYSGRIDNQTSTTSVMQLIKSACKEKVLPVDKLNKIETGLLLFTNDTDLAKKLGRSKKNIKEIYQITLDKRLNQSDLENIRDGIFLNGRSVKLDLISYIKGKDKNELGIENSNGGIKSVKQVFERLNYNIVRLDRVFIGGLTKKDLPRKHYRHLTKEEINILRRL